MPATSKKRGRQPDANSKSGQIRELLKTDMSAGDIAKKLGCTPALVYNVKARAAGGGTMRRGPGRPPKSAPPVSNATGLEGILAAVRSNEQQRNQMRSALERIQAVITSALS